MINCIFDFNGTMMFDGDIQNNSQRKYLETKINRPILEDEFQKYVHGKNIIDTFKYFLNIECSPEEALKIGEEKEVIYRKMCLESPDFKLAVGLVDFLDYLKKREQIEISQRLRLFQMLNSSLITLIQIIGLI